MISLLIFILAVFMSACNMAYDGNNPNKKGDSAREVRRRVAYKLKKEKELYPCGTGAQMMDEIQMLGLAFNYFQPVDIEKSRKLLIDAVDEFVNAVNEDTEIRPYLGNYPFEPKNIDIRIFMKNRDGSELPRGVLHCISSIDGILEYDISDPQTGRLRTIFKETYAEALERLGRKELKKNDFLSISLEGNSRTP